MEKKQKKDFLQSHTFQIKNTHDESNDSVYDDDFDDDDFENDSYGDEKESRARRSESCDAVVRPVLVPRRRTSLRRTQG